MLVSINSAKCVGIEAVRVVVEVHIDSGIGIHLVGLADAAVRESLLRTTTALQSLGFHIPGKKIVINLAPADLHKSGSGYDLPIALGIIAASGQRALPKLENYLVLGELGLDGSVRPVPGALPCTELALSLGLEGVILPVESSLESVEFESAKVYGAETLTDVLRILSNEGPCEDLLAVNTQAYRRARRQRHHGCRERAGMDFSDIIGQEGAKRALEIAAAGGHNLIMIGPPGSGKSSLAKAFPGILPPLNHDESLVTSKIYSIAGLGTSGCGLLSGRPFRSPHYSASLAAIIGGGGGDAVLPGEISLAHNGVLFLDELAQMPRSVIEALRGPLEDRKVTVSRLRTKITYPSSFMLLAATNPCPCGYYGEGDRCTCTPVQRQNYMSRLSGPIMDRIDLHCALSPVPSEVIVGAGKAESSAEVAKRVLRARELQAARFWGEEINTNAEMTNRHIEKYCPLSGGCAEKMSQLLSGMGLSMRAYFRIIKVARTVADLEGERDILVRHIVEAAGFRFLDKKKIWD